MTDRSKITPYTLRSLLEEFPFAEHPRANRELQRLESLRVLVDVLETEFYANRLATQK